MCDSSRNRLLLKPWLELKINSGNIPGLYWFDPSQKIFRISWKRNGTSDWAQEDSTIFLEWAIHTGKYREGDKKKDYPTWKTQLRNALNKHPEIKQLKNNASLDTNDPYRVYQIIDKPSHCEFLPTQENVVEMVDCAQFQSQVCIEPGIPNNDMDFHNIQDIFPEQDMLVTGSLDSDMKKIDTKALIPPMSPEEFNKYNTDFEVIIRFQSEEVHKTIVKGGCFLTTYDPQCVMNDCQVIKFPVITPKTSEVENLISELWPNMKDGVYIRMDEHKNILAQRYCKCRIYYRDQNNNNGWKLERSDGRSWSIIFNYEEFLRYLKFNNPLIHADVTLYIGQKGDPNPYNVFYSVTICHLLAKQHLTERNFETHSKVSISI